MFFFLAIFCVECMTSCRNICVKDANLNAGKSQNIYYKMYLFSYMVLKSAQHERVSTSKEDSEVMGLNLNKENSHQ